MSINILYSIHEGKACMYDGTTGVAFGPVVDDGDDDAQATLETFQDWLSEDARTYSGGELMKQWIRFMEGK